MSQNGFLKEEDNESADESFASSDSLSRYENTSLKKLRPQIVAAVVSTLPHLLTDPFNYLQIVVRRSERNSDFPIKVDRQKPEQHHWITATIVLSMFVGGTICGVLMERFGRLRTIGFSMIIGMIGWITVAASSSREQVLAGLVIQAVAVVWSTFSAMAYITEIAHPDIRGSLLWLAPLFKILAYGLLDLMSLKLNWRIIAGSDTFLSIITFVLLFFIPESPVWLVSKERFQEAKKSLQWFDKHQPPINNNTFAQLHFKYLLKTKTPWREGCCGKVKEFFKLFYKPFLILLGLYVIKWWTGIYFMIKQFGSEIQNEETAVRIVFGVQVTLYFVNIFLLRIFGRRTLLIWGSGAAALSMLAHAIYIYFHGNSIPSSGWISPALILLCLIFLSLIVPIPATMIGELFPDQIRGMACNIMSPSIDLIWISSGLVDVLLTRIWRGPTGFECSYVVLLLLGMVYTCIFVPETHRVKLSDVQKYFECDQVYIKWVLAKKREDRRQNQEMTMDNV